MQEILKFKDNHQEYSLLLDKDKLVYQKQIDNIITFDLNKEEIELINSVLVKVVPSNEIKKLDSFIYENKIINHSYDLINNIHIFFDEDKKVSFECLKLSYLFNNQEEYFLSLSKRKKSSPKYVQRIIKIGKKS